jgi:hypothetical protein
MGEVGLRWRFGGNVRYERVEEEEVEEERK